jgi:hypothetical protein
MAIIDMAFRDISFLDIATKNKMAVYKSNLLAAQNVFANDAQL